MFFPIFNLLLTGSRSELFQPMVPIVTFEAPAFAHQLLWSFLAAAAVVRADVAHLVPNVFHLLHVMMPMFSVGYVYRLT